MKEPCDRCPCPAICLRWPSFCEGASKPDPDPVLLRHICERSKLGPAIQSPPSDLPAGYVDRLPPLGGCCG